MSILFSKQGKTVVKWVFSVLAILIIISMILAFFAGV
jgi:hypothetical protein